MVEDHATDGERLAQLLASELSGRSDGTPGRFSVVDADRDATPTPEGTVAYRVAVDDQRVAAVHIYPERAEVAVEPASSVLDIAAVVDAVSGPGLSTESTADEGVVRIGYGAAVKRAVDALVAGVDS
jgi:ABC-type branched-subunit amino acid transport system substrate-binding protein